MPEPVTDRGVDQLRFRDPARARALAAALEQLCAQIGRDTVSVMHVCGSHEQSIAKFGLRTLLPAGAQRHHGTGLPGLRHRRARGGRGGGAGAGWRRSSPPTATCSGCPAPSRSLADAQAEGARIEVLYSAAAGGRAGPRHHRGGGVLRQRIRDHRGGDRGRRARRDPPPNFSVLSAHKYIPPVMEIVAEMPGTRVEGFLAAGHAATITGSAIFERFVEHHRHPGRGRRLRAARHPGRPGQAGRADPRRDAGGGQHVSRAASRRRATATRRTQLWRVFRPIGGHWRGIAHVPNGNLRLRDEFAHLDARRRFAIDLAALWDYAPPALTQSCICGDIMAGIASPARLPALRQGVHARHAGRRLHGLAPRAPARSGISTEDIPI